MSPTPSPTVSAPVLPLLRIAVVWSFLTAAALCGPCRAPVASPALAAEACA